MRARGKEEGGRFPNPAWASCHFDEVVIGNYCRRMSLTVLSLDVANPGVPDRREPVEFLVDSGAVYSFVPRAILERLNIHAHSRLKFRLADGSVIERDRGDALFFYRGVRGASPVIFGELGDATLLGAVTLEALGFVLDAIRRDLLPLPMVIAGTPRT